jgi:heat-inducible transcriptional repressor
MLSERQEKLLNFVIKEYIDTAEPVSSKALKKVAGLDVSEATVRNDLQVLAEQGYITQPHTSAGRIPTKKAYKYFSDKFETTATFYNVEVNIVRMSIVRQVKATQEEIEKQMSVMENIMEKLEQDDLFEILNILEKWHNQLK